MGTVVTQSTSLVQIDTSQVVFPNNAVVLLSTLNAPGTLITIRDVAGFASTNRGITVSTTNNVHFLDGPTCNAYYITQPYGFLTVTPKTSSIWAVTNTFAFPDQSAAANVNQFTAKFATVSSMFTNFASMSTAQVSTLSVQTLQVLTNLSVAQSIITDTLYVDGSIFVASTMSVAGAIVAGSSIQACCGDFTSTMLTPLAQLQLSTGLALDSAGDVRIRGGISTFGSLYVGREISTLSSMAVGGNLNVNGALGVRGGMQITGGFSTTGSLGVGQDAQLNSSLQVRDNVFAYRHLSVSSNLNVAGTISALSNVFIGGNLQVASNTLLLTNMSIMSNVYIASTLSVGGNLVVDGDLIFNDSRVDLNNLSVLSNLFVGNALSVASSITTRGLLYVGGSTLMLGHLSAASTATFGGNVSTLGNFAVGGSIDFLSSVIARAAVCTLSNVTLTGGLLSTTSSVAIGHGLTVGSNLLVGGAVSSIGSLAVGGAATVTGQTYLSSGLSTIGVAAFFSSVQIQGAVSVMSSVYVRQDLRVDGTLITTGGNSFSGTTNFANVQVQTSTNFSLTLGGSTLQAGLFSTLGNIDMGGRFSTPNAIVTGSTLNARWVVATTAVSSLGSVGVASNLQVLGDTQLQTLTANSNVVLGGSGTSNQFNGCNVFNTKPRFAQGFEGPNSLIEMNTSGYLALAGIRTFDSAVDTNNLSNPTFFTRSVDVSSLNTSNNATVGKHMSVIGQTAFFSSVQIQGGLSVFSSVGLACNLNVLGTLTAGNIQMPGGAVFQTVGVNQTSNFTLNVSSSTLHVGLFSTSGAIFTGREISTTSSIAVGGGANILCNTTIGGNLSTLLSTAVGGGLTVAGGIVGSLATLGSGVSTTNINASNSIQTPFFSSLREQTSSLGVGVNLPAYQVDVAGTVNITGTGRSNTLRLAGTSAGITFSNSGTGNYTIFNDASNNGLLIRDDADAVRFALRPNAQNALAINKTTAAAALDVNGLILGSNIGAPSAQFSTLGASTLTVSSLTAATNITVTAGQAGAFAIDVTAAASAGVNIRSLEPSLFLSNTGNTRVLQMVVSCNFGQYANDSVAGDSVIRTDTTNSKLLFTNGANNTTLAVTSGRVGIANVAPATTLDVAGTINARTMLQAPAGVISSLGASSFTTSTFVTNLFTASAINTSSISTTTINSSNSSTNTLQANLALVSTLSTNGTVNVGSNLTVGASTLVANTTSNSVTINGSLTQGNNQRILVAGGGDTGQFWKIVYSTNNGTSFINTNVNGTDSGRCRNIATNGRIFVAVGNRLSGTNSFYTSFDGVTWTARGSSVLTDGINIIWDGRQFIAVGSGTNTLAVSPDGLNWTASNPSDGNTVNGIDFNGTFYIIGTQDGKIYRSSNLTSWTNITSGIPSAFDAIRGVLWTGTRWIIGGDSQGADNFCVSFDNGITWTVLAVSGISSAGNYGNTKYAVNGQTVVVGGGGGGSPISYSTDGGATFTAVNIANVSEMTTIIWTGTQFLATVLGTSGQIATSPNGITWTVVSGTSFTSNLGNGVAAWSFTTRLQETNFGLLAADSISTTGTLTVGSNFTVGQSTIVANPTYQNVGINCNAPRFTLDVNGNINAGGNLFVAGSIFQGGSAGGPIFSTSLFGASSIQTSSLNTSVTLVASNAVPFRLWTGYADLNTTAGAGGMQTSTDGITWTNVTLGTAPTRIDGVAYNGSIYAAYGINNAKNNGVIYISRDGVNWSLPTSQPQNIAGIFSMQWNGRYWLIAGGGSPTTNYMFTSTDLSTYTTAQAGLPAGSWRATWNGTLWVATGKDNSGAAAQNIYYSYDGANWSVGVNGFNQSPSSRGHNVFWFAPYWFACGLDNVASAPPGCPIKYSLDGIVWQNTNMPTVALLINVLNIAFNGKQYIAVGNTSSSTGAWAYSYDGINWSLGKGTVSGAFRNVAWTGSIWVFTASDSTNGIYYSRDGITLVSSTGGLALVNIFGLNVSYHTQPDLQVGNTNIYLNPTPTQITSTSAINMTSNALLLNNLYTDTQGFVGVNCNAPVGHLTVNGFATIMNNQIQKVFIVNTADTSAPIKYSLNGSNWFQASMTGLPNSPNSFAAAFNGKTWLGFANTNTNTVGNTAFTSSNGVNWTFVANTSNLPSARVLRVIWAVDKWVIVIGSTGVQVAYSYDGSTWINSVSNTFGSIGSDIAFNGRRYVLIGSQGTTGVQIVFTDNIQGGTWSSWTNSGAAWSEGRSVATNGRLWVATGVPTVAGQATIKYSIDGSTWLDCAGTFSASGWGVATNGSLWVAIGVDATAANIIKYSRDGITWLNSAGAFPSGGVGSGSVIWTGSQWVVGGYTSASSPLVYFSSNGINWTAASTANLGSAVIRGMAYSSNVIPDLQVENLAIFGCNQWPMHLSTNSIKISNSNLTINDFVTINSNTNSAVGIGTPSPQTTLHVFQPVTGHPSTLRLECLTATFGNSANGARLDFWTRFTGNGASYFQGAIQGIDTRALDSGYGGLAFLGYSNQNQIEVMRIDGDGRRVGIGTTAPGKALEVMGGIATCNSGFYGANLSQYVGTGTGFNLITDSAGAVGLWLFRDANNHCSLQSRVLSNGTTITAMHIASNGNVGIRTTSPAYPLTINGTQSNLLNLEYGGNSLGVGGQIGFSGNPGAAPMAAIRGSLEIAQSSPAQDSGNLIFSTRPTAAGSLTDRMTIMCNGNVGIGTTSPSNILHISSNIGYQPSANPMFSQVMINSFSARLKIGMQYTGNVGACGLIQACDFFNNVDNGTTLYLNQLGGNVSIQTTDATYNLTLGGATLGIPNRSAWYAKNATGSYELFMHPRWDDNVMYINMGSAGLRIRNNTGEQTRMSINSSGYVGIGTTTPGFSLEVTGKTRLTSGVAFSSTETDFINNVSAYGIGMANYNVCGMGYGQNLAIQSYYGISFMVGDTQWTAGTPQMVIGRNRVGINTTSPICPLHVVGSVTNNIPAGGQVSGSGAGSWGGGNEGVGIYATNTVWSGVRFVATSDERIKKNILPATPILSTLLQIPIRSFDYRDPSNKTHVSHGVIAQEVKTVYPELVHAQKEYVPHLSEETSTISYNSVTSTTTLTFSTPHTLSTSDMISLTILPDFDKEGNLNLDSNGKPTYLGKKFNTEILETPSVHSITVKQWEDFQPARPVKLVEKQVDDFLTVDKPLLGTLAVAAIQELYKELQETKSTLAALLAKYPL